jgi:hypothetical protein
MDAPGQEQGVWLRASVMGCLLGVAWWIPTACTPPADPPQVDQPDAVENVLEIESPAEALSQVEADLMTGEGRTVDFQVVSEGAFSASLQGQVVLGAGDELSLEASGTFGADSVRLWVRGTGDRMMWGNGATSSEDELPPALREAVVIGLVRMGVLHNLARLVSGAPPDRTDGTVRSWVQTEEVRWVPGEPEDGARGIEFGILVSGERSADATVWLDADGRLIGRDQVVEFPGGQMRVIERYVVRD